MSKQQYSWLMLKVCLLFTTLSVTSCIDTGADQLRIPLYVSGIALENFGTLTQQPMSEDADVPAIELDSGQYLLIDQAKLAFGSLYLCAGTSAGDLCDTARAEWLDSVVIDLLDEQIMSAGELIGHSGIVRSWMFDLGLSSLLTHRTPYELEAAQELNGASLVLNGRVRNKMNQDETNTTDGIEEFPFSISVKIQQSEDTELGVPVIRKSNSESFEHDLTKGDSSLLIRFPLASWLRNLKFSSYFRTIDQACEGGNPDQVQTDYKLSCLGTIEQTCNLNTGEVETRDCSNFSQHCLPNYGCVDELKITSDSEQYRTVRNAILIEGRPDFVWNKLD